MRVGINIIILRQCNQTIYQLIFSRYLNFLIFSRYLIFLIFSQSLNFLIQRIIIQFLKKYIDAFSFFLLTNFINPIIYFIVTYTQNYIIIIFLKVKRVEELSDSEDSSPIPEDELAQEDLDNKLKQYKFRTSLNQMSNPRLSLQLSSDYDIRIRSEVVKHSRTGNSLSPRYDSKMFSSTPSQKVNSTSKHTSCFPSRKILPITRLKNVHKSFYMSQGPKKYRFRNQKQVPQVRYKQIVPPRSWESCKQVLQSVNKYKPKEEAKKSSHFCNYITEPPLEGILQIEVEDTGCGISEDSQKKLFQPFSQAHKGVYGEYGGTGLGLWISKKLILAMQGDIQCESEINKGTKFIVQIPTKKNDQKKRVNKISIFKKLTIVVYIKAPQNIKNCAEEMGCTTKICSTFEQLLEILRGHQETRQQGLVLVTNFKVAKKVKKLSKVEDLNLKLNQIVVVINNMNKNCEPFIYVVKRPTNYPLLTNLFSHIIRGMAINSDNIRFCRSVSIKGELALSQYLPPQNFFRVLVVDDNAFVLGSIVRQLKKYTKFIVECEDGLEGFQAFKENASQLHLAILDMQMPKLNGIQLAKACREYEKEQKLKPVPILLLSGDSLQSRDCEAIITYHKQKPLARAALENILADIYSSLSK